ncbi:MAG: 1-deoxy-D-xylulose-5-phosphate synthase [Clostridiales Family XIII bacterium]|jgi:1-deoxy-D-xylulose-5-phosphate synthase|nr:1-deoxy-D-xylulose-5-phosphate synthase [Clostridiales Family XIII bacterium]
MKKKLSDYDFPADLADMDERALELLSYQIRDFLISSVSKTGGHLASNLGVVELSIALHKVFQTPKDRIVWDVGHQTYVHKILTGRASRFDKLRRDGGLSGFPKREESPHDHCDTGHGSTSISVAMGMAEARDIEGGDYSVVAVIGDGALTGGLAYEGLNNAGARKANLIVVLNDNEMSIAENTGSISRHLSRLRASKTYLGLKKNLKRALHEIPFVGVRLYSGAEHIRKALKDLSSLSDGIFDDMGFRYFGPVDGNNIRDLTYMLSAAKQIDGPVLIHAVTKKGKGYRNAEINPEKFHGIGPFDPATGRELCGGEGRSYSNIFGGRLTDMAARDKRVVAITAAMPYATGLSGFAERHPERMFDVGIAEAHAVSFAAGLALNGLRPFIAIYSTFLQRAYDQILIDICLQKLPVVFCIDRAGNVGHDGETHHGIFDISYLRHMPNMTVMAPMDGRELEEMLEFSLRLSAPCAIRYPRGNAPSAPGVKSKRKRAPLNLGVSERLLSGDAVEIWGVGKMLGVGEKVRGILKKRGVSCGLVNARFVKPLDEEALLKAAAAGKYILTLEDNVSAGGFGESVVALLNRNGFASAKISTVAWPDEFIGQGNVNSLMKQYGMDAESIAERLCALFERTT